MSNIKFIYASYYNINSKIIPTIIDKNSFNCIYSCFVNYDDKYLIKSKIPELKQEINQSSFEIFKSDGFERYLETNMNDYFVFSRNLKSENNILRLLFVSKEEKIDHNVKEFYSTEMSIDDFLSNFQFDLLEIFKKSDAIQKISFFEEENNVKTHHDKYCNEKIKIFVGREEQICYIEERIKDPRVSHMIIHGESGCGKTRYIK